VGIFIVWDYANDEHFPIVLAAIAEAQQHVDIAVASKEDLYYAAR